MAVIVRLASLYAAIGFAFGVALGSIRELYVRPVTGEFSAVLIELPVMLVLSWFVAAWIFRGRGLTPQQGIEIGLTAFLLLQVVDTLIFSLAGPFTFIDNVLYYLGDLAPPRAAGLVSQILFAAIPFVQILRSRHHDS